MAKIMVVDDEEKNLEMLDDFLVSRGYEVITASGGKEALEKMSEKPDLVLLDIMMPDIQGLNVLERMKEIEPDIGIIMVTALAEHDVGLESFKKGAFEFVTKPIDLKYLETAISVKLAQNVVE